MNGLELPPAIRKYYNSEMREIAARSYILFTSNKFQQRLRGGKYKTINSGKLITRING